MERLTTFANRKLYDGAVEVLRARGLRFEVISPDPGYGKVGVPALAADADAAPVLSDAGAYVSGWVDFQADDIVDAWRVLENKFQRMETVVRRVAGVVLIGVGFYFLWTF